MKLQMQSICLVRPRQWKASFSVILLTNSRREILPCKHNWGHYLCKYSVLKCLKNSKCLMDTSLSWNWLLKCQDHTNPETGFSLKVQDHWNRMKQPTRPEINSGPITKLVLSMPIDSLILSLVSFNSLSISFMLVNITNWNNKSSKFHTEVRT